MPKVTGIFDSFANLEQISVEDLTLAIHIDTQNLQNYLANRILYPQAAAITKQEMVLDLAILKLGLKQNSVFYHPKEKKLIIPESFYERFPNLVDLATAFIDVFLPADSTTIILAKINGDEVLGTYLQAEFSNQKPVNLMVEEQSFQIKPGRNILPCLRQHCHINFRSDSAKIQNKNELVFEVLGGALGLVIDGRMR